MNNVFRFSLRSLFTATTCIGVALAVTNAPVKWQSGIALTLLTTCVPPAIATSLLHLTGYRRAFWLGALFPACVAVWPMTVGILNANTFGNNAIAGEGVMWQAVGDFFKSLFGYSRHSIAVLWLLMPFAGLSAMGAELAFTQCKRAPTDRLAQ